MIQSRVACSFRRISWRRCDRVASLFYWYPEKTIGHYNCFLIVVAIAGEKEFPFHPLCRHPCDFHFSLPSIPNPDIIIRCEIGVTISEIYFLPGGQYFFCCKEARCIYRHRKIPRSLQLFQEASWHEPYTFCH